MINEHDIELLEGYMEGKLNEEELASFLQKENQDPDFATLIKIRKTIGDKWAGAASYAEAGKWIAETLQGQRSKKPVIGNKTLWFALAAIIILLIGITAIIKYAGGGSNEQQRFASDTSLLEIELKHTGPQDPKAYSDTLFIEPGLKTPINNEIMDISDNIAFRWDTSQRPVKELNISLSRNDSVVFSVRLEGDQTTYVIKAGTLQQGYYYWQLRPSSEKGYFIIE